MAITKYKQELGPVGAGTPTRYDAGRQGLTYLNPIVDQVDNYDVTTGDAAEWSALVTLTASGESRTFAWTPPGATEAEVVASFIAGWNADPNNLVFARAKAGADATEFNLCYATGDAYTLVVTPGGAGAGTLTSAAASSFTQGFGFWAFRKLFADVVTTEDGRTLVNPDGAGNLITNLAGVTIKSYHIENPDPRCGPVAGGFYPAGYDVPVMRRGYIMVPVTVDVKPGDSVFALIAGPNAGKTAKSGGVDLSSVAKFMSVAKAGTNAEIELTIA
jgi:hypothetical protein